MRFLRLLLHVLPGLWPIASFSQDAVSLHNKIPKRYHSFKKAITAGFVPENRESFHIIQKNRLFKGITLSLIQATPRVIFDTLHALFRHELFLPADVFDLPGKADLRVHDASLIEIIQILANKLPIGYSLAGNYIVVYVKEFPVNYNSQAGIRDLNPAAIKSMAESLTSIRLLKDVVVKSYYNGYDKIPQEVATGSFSETPISRYQLVNNSPNIIERFNSISILFPIENNDPLTGPVPLSFRGINSPYGNQKAVTFMDDFKLFYSTNAVNPFDIGASTMLRDAAAGTLHGTSSANGSLVLQTKDGISKGKEFNFIARTTIGQRPNLNEQAGLNASELINFQRAMYEQYGSSSLPFNSPVRNLLDKKNSGVISYQQATDTFDLWSKNNFRKQLQREFYTNSIAQQYALNFRSGTNKTKTYVSFGLDKIKKPEIGNSWERQTFMGKFTFDNDTFLVKVNVSIANINSRDNAVFVPTGISYWNIFDTNGQPQNMPFGLSPDGSNASGSGYFLPWTFNPVKEQKLSDNKTNQKFYVVNGKFGYSIRKNLQITFAVQKAYTIYDHRINYPLGSWYANNLINTFRTLDNLGHPVWNIPLGSISDQSFVNAFTSQWRTQIKYGNTWRKFKFSSIAGFEKINHEMRFRSTREYGKDVGFPQSAIDYINPIQLTVPAGKMDRIQNNNRQKDSAEHFFNFYGTAYCTFYSKYTFAIVLRTDLSNRFSDELNRFGIKLWSASTTWDITRELFFKSDFINFLKWRVSYGVNGNIDYSILPVRAMESINNQNMLTGIIRPQSQNLSYEKIYQFNTGFDFQIANKSITGSLDYFKKSGVHLKNYTFENPTLGNEVIVDNSGKLHSYGFDLYLETADIDVINSVKYSATFNLAHNRNRVTSAAVPKAARDYTNPLTYDPLRGHPASSIFAFQSAGLNPLNGNPRGYLNGSISENYAELVNAMNGSTLQYIGSAVPTWMANSFQTLKCHSVSLSVLLNGRFGYYGRTKPLDYNELLQQINDGTIDFSKRWQKPGDEIHTSIHSFQYPFDYNREQFAKGLNTYVVKADNIYLQSVQFSYEFNEQRHSPLHLKKLQVIVSVNNIGFLYRANKALNPNFIPGSYSIPRSFTFTLSSTF